MRITALSLSAILWAILFVLQGCATTNPNNSILVAKQTETEKTLTKDAFLRIEPIIKTLRPDQPVSEAKTKLKWAIYPVKLGGKVADVCALADGWAGDLSGNAIGASSGLGLPFAYKDSFIYGQHVYGYVISPAIFLPMYSVQTKAQVITEAEYLALKANEVPNIGWSYRPGEQNMKVFFKDVMIYQVREIATPEKKHTGFHLGPRMPTSQIADDFKAFLSKERYESIAEKLFKLSVGSDLFATVEELDGNIIANYGGVEITFIITGFLNYKGQYRFAKMTSNGIYNVMPFGYVENEQEIPKTALIFKNGLLHEVIPYSTRKQIEETLN